MIFAGPAMTHDLDNYADVIHHSPAIDLKVLSWLASGTHLVDRADSGASATAQGPGRVLPRRAMSARLNSVVGDLWRLRTTQRVAEVDLINFDTVDESSILRLQLIQRVDNLVGRENLRQMARIRDIFRMEGGQHAVVTIPDLNPYIKPTSR